MHRLVPSLITDNLSHNRLQGEFSCAALFVDISGFTLVTETLMKHGQHGAEVLAMIMRTIFTPVIYSVYEQGGFVTNFAGDALTAVFPSNAEDGGDAVLRALAAAWQIQLHMKIHAQQKTEYGDFSFSAKAGLAAGDVTWGIIEGGPTGRAAYYFKGTAIEGSVRAEQIAQAGEIIADLSANEVVQNCVLAERVDAFWQIKSITSTLPQPKPVALPNPDVDQMARFFPRSLIEQESSGEFRQVINLFIGLQGMPNHAELAAFMQQVFLLQEAYGGILNRIDFADKGCHLLLFWGAPTSYENDVTRVLDFILDLRKASKLTMRAGITYRIAHAGCIGSSLAEEYTCYGRGVNLAARYMMSAEWDEVWLDGETARRAETGFRLHALGSRKFKGFAEYQPVFRLGSQREDIVFGFDEGPLIGRRNELGRLRESIQPIYEGQFAGVTIVYGEAGIGKSRLVQAFLDETCRRKQTTVFLCQTDEILRRSLNPFHYFLRHYFDQSAAQDESANKQRFEQILERLLWSVSDEEIRAELERTTSFLGSMVGLRWENSLYEQLDPELRFENTQNALKTLFKAESLNGPLIIQLEDAHWLDEDSIGFLGRLTRNVAGYPFVLLINSRTELQGDIFQADARRTMVELQALDVENLAELAEAVLGQKPSQALVGLLTKRTDGNPFFTEQMLLYLQENNLIERVQEAEGAALPDDVYLPTDVRTVLTARLDRLPQAVKDVVQKAAVLGREFEVPILAYMVDHDPQLDSKLKTAEGEAVWFALDPLRYFFQHALLRDASYDMQLHSRLRRLHKLAAQAFEDQYIQDPDLTSRFPAIAYHFDKAEERAEAMHYYGEAGEQAKEKYRNTEAIGHYSRGLELAEDLDEPAMYSFLCGRETIYQWIGQRDQQKNDLARLSELMAMYPDDLKQADLALRQSAFALVTGDYDSAVTEAKRSLAFAKPAGDMVSMAKAYHRWGRTLWEQGNGREAEKYLNRALDLTRSGQNRPVEAECLFDLSVVQRMETRYSEAERLLLLAEIVYEEIDDEQGLIKCQNELGVIGYDLGHFISAREHYLHALMLCQKAGWRYAEATVLLNIGNSYFDLGDYGKAGEYHKQALALSREIGDQRAEVRSLDTIGLIFYYQKKLSEAIEYYEEAYIINQLIDNRSDLGYLLTHMGYALIAIGKHGEANSKLSEALKLRRELGATALTIDTLGGLALVELTTGKVNKACRIVSEILSYLDDSGPEGIDLPVQVYLISYRTLSAAAKTDKQLLTLAQSVLEAGHELLLERSADLKDKETRRQFMEQVPYNRELHAAWLETQ